MKKFLKIFSCTLIVVIFSIAMAILSSETATKKRDNNIAGVHILEKNGFYDSLDFLEENAISEIFKIENTEKITPTKPVITKYSRARPIIEQVFESSLTSLGFVPAAPPMKIPGSNVILTAYKEENPTTIQSEEARQTKLFNELIGLSIGLTITEIDMRVFKIVTASMRIRLTNEALREVGAEVTPEGYRQFSNGSKSDRLEQVAQFFEEAGIPADQNTIEIFVEEYSQFPGIPAAR